MVVCRSTCTLGSFRPSFLKTYTVWRPVYNAVNLSVRTGVTPWHRGRLGICRIRQILVSCRTNLWKVSEGRKDWSLLLELNLWNVMTMRSGRDNRLGNVLCSCTHARRLVGARCCGSACMPYPDPCRQLWVPECLAEADSCSCGTEESWKEPHGYMESACKLPPSGILHVHMHFCQDPLPREIEFWIKFPDLREEDNT